MRGQEEQMRKPPYLISLFLFLSVPGSAQLGPADEPQKAKGPCQIWIDNNVQLREDPKSPGIKSIWVKDASGDFAPPKNDLPLNTAAGLCLTYSRIKDMGREAAEAGNDAI